MAILSIFGFLVDPTNSYSSQLHLSFSNGFVWFVTTIVSAITPLSFLILSLLVLSALTPSLPSISISPLVAIPLGIYTGLEVLWHFYCTSLEAGFNIPTSFANPGLTSEARRQTLRRILDHCSDPWAALSRWFYTHHPDSVGEDCLQAWLCWAFFSKELPELSGREGEELEALVATVMERYPQDKARLRNKGRLNFMRLHFDPIVVQHKPLIAYLVISLMQIVGGMYMSWVLGFCHHSLPGTTASSSKSTLSYWIYEPSKPNSSQPSKNNDDEDEELINDNNNPNNNPSDDKSPIFIVHGIGIGVTMYINMIKSLVKESSSGRTIIFLNLPHISLNVVDSVPDVDATMRAIDTIFFRHHLQSCSWLAHSYGTIVTTWVLKQRPDYISKICFVDPVCFALWEPDLIYNFLYRVPQCPIHRIAQYFVAQDLLVSYTLFRNFWWLENLLLPEDVHCGISIFLSSHDFIIDAAKTCAYLEERVKEMGRQKKKDKQKMMSDEDNMEKNFGIVKMQGLSHGSFLNSKKYTKDIVNCL